MPLQITSLRHWKREYDCLENCEDAVSYSEENGLFAISDGVGMASFSHIWSRVLVEQFIECPFFETNAFEVLRLLRAAQQKFKSELPDPETIPSHLRGVLDKPTAATFLGAFIQSETIEGEPRVTLHVLGLGDSCVLHCRDKACIDSFPLQKSADFDRAPDTLRSQGLNVEDATFEQYECNLRTGDLVILATDAVAEWLLYGEPDNAESKAVRSDRLAMLQAQDKESWPHFIKTLRDANLIVDDDSTVLIIHVLQHDNIAPQANDFQVAMKDARFKEFKQAHSNRKKTFTDLALAYGSGAQLSGTRAAKPKYENRALKAQEQTKAFYRLLAALRRQITKPSDANTLALKKTWIAVRNQLLGQAEAEGVIATLEKRGIPRDFQFAEPGSAKPDSKGIEKETEKSPPTKESKAAHDEHATDATTAEASIENNVTRDPPPQQDQPAENDGDQSKEIRKVPDDAERSPPPGATLSDTSVESNQQQTPNAPPLPHSKISHDGISEPPSHNERDISEAGDCENSIPNPPPIEKQTPKGILKENHECQDDEGE